MEALALLFALSSALSVAILAIASRSEHDRQRELTAGLRAGLEALARRLAPAAEARVDALDAAITARLALLEGSTPEQALAFLGALRAAEAADRVPPEPAATTAASSAPAVGPGSLPHVDPLAEACRGPARGP